MPKKKKIQIPSTSPKKTPHNANTQLLRLCIYLFLLLNRTNCTVECLDHPIVSSCASFLDSVHGETVAIDVEYLQRMEEVWGANAKDFRPSRWIEVESEPDAEHKKAWMPFGNGSYRCPVHNLAPMMIGILVGILLESFGSSMWRLVGQNESALNEEVLENGREAFEGLWIRKVRTENI